MWNWNSKKKEEKAKDSLELKLEKETESYRKLILASKEVAESKQEDIAAIIMTGKIDKVSKGLKEVDIIHVQGNPLSLSKLLLDTALKDESGSFGGIILSVAQVLKNRDPKLQEIDDMLNKASQEMNKRGANQKDSSGIDLSNIDLSNMSEKEIIELGKKIAGR